MAKTLVKNYVFKPGFGLSEDFHPNASSLLESNKDFIVSEIIAYINDEVQNTVKCKRDLDYIFDGLIYDVGLDTNYNARFLGFTETNSLDLSNTVSRIITNTIEETKTVQIGTGEFIGPLSQTITDKIESYKVELINIIENGKTVASALDFTNPITAGSNVIATKDKLLANIDFITAEINAYVEVNYAPTDHDVSKCTRDIIYIIEACCYDVLYGGNSATYDQSKFFFYHLDNNDPGIDPSHKEQTVAAYTHLKAIISDIITGTAITPSTGNNEVQITSGNNGTISETSYVETLVQITIDVLGANDLAEATVVLDAIVRTAPSISLWANQETTDATTAILFRKDEIIENNTFDENYTYNVEKCQRDVRYVLDAYSTDLKYGGNENTRKVVKYYWDQDVAQIDGNRIPEIMTHFFIGDLIVENIFQNVAWTNLGGTSQTIDESKQAESTAFSVLNNLVSITTQVIRGGLDFIPELSSNSLGYIQIQGKYNLSEILLINNATTNTIIYSFNNNAQGGEIEITDSFRDYNSDFPTYLQTTDGITTLKLRFSTNTMAATDDIQIFVETLENAKSVVITRPYNFGTDAIERNRVAEPLSMLDADFEYGLQPTKWAAISTLRGYPSIYEIPGSDILVSSITTDASSGTNGVGQSLITVTTVGAHGIDVGDPITIKALNDGVTGVARAEGSFVVINVPSNTTLEYYAKAKVGSTAGEDLTNTYSQLRKGRFYTGADIGGAEFTVLSQGANTTITVELDTDPGSTIIPFDGPAPDVGSPASNAKITTGAQVTAVQTTSTGGGLYLTAQVFNDYNTFTNQIDFVDVTGIIDNLAIDNGNGTAVFVESVVGNTVTFTSEVERTFIGETSVYSNLTGALLAPVGTNATFDITATGTTYTVTINTAGVDYFPGNRIEIAGFLVGGQDNINDINIFVDSVDGVGGITNITASGTAFAGEATLTNFDLPGTGATGTNAVWDIEWLNNVYTVSLVSPDLSQDFDIDDRIIIPYTALGITGTSSSNTIVIRVNSVTGIGNIETFTVESGTGPDQTAVYNNPQYSITGSGTITSIVISQVGTQYFLDQLNATGFAQNDQIQILGSELGGNDPTNNLTITITQVDAGAITATTLSGTAYNYGFVSAASSNVVTSIGAQADITLSAGAYSSVTIVSPGILFYVGQTITIPGNLLLGATPTNDLLLDVTAVDDMNRLVSVAVNTGIASTGVSPVNNVGGTNITPNGNGATFEVTRSSGTYTATVSSGGQNYAVGDRLLIAGNLLGGDQTNSLTIIINEELNGAIQDDSSGTISLEYSSTATGDTVDFISTITISEPTTQPLLSAETVDFTAIATLQITFDNPHGLVPGNTFIVGVTSDDGLNNHNLAAGSFFATNIPALDQLTYTARAVGFIDEDIQPVQTTTTLFDSQDPTWWESGVKLVQGANANYVKIRKNSTTLVDVNDIENATEYAEILSFVPPKWVYTGTAYFYERGTLQNSFTNEWGNTSSLYELDETITEDEAQDPIVASVYPRPDSFFVHRPYDGGVQLGTGGPQHGAQAIRQSKKYIRYQSGKGIMYTTGALFAPSYDLASVVSTGNEVGSIITITTDNNDHGVQEGGVIRLLGIETPGYNSGPYTAVPPNFDYTVTSVIDEKTFTVRAQRRLGALEAVLGFGAQMSVVSWHGATVRAGIFDDQNGIFWENDGTQISVVQRTGTKQIAGTISLNPDTNLVTGTNTRFLDQIKNGDRIIIKGMTHLVTGVDSQTVCYIAPDFRGVSAITGAKVALIVDKKVKQSEFNMDRLDGTGPSGYEIDVATMQMIGIQYSWYGAGFIDFMLRGSDGNFVFAHRMRNSNINTEAFMRSGNLPVRYEVTNEGPPGRLKVDLTNSATELTLYDSSFFPNAGYVYIENEVIEFTGNDKDNNKLTGLLRAASYSVFQAGALRSFSAGAAATHTAGEGVILISQTITPLISHWGSAFLTDGGFDEDRGYIFSYAATGLSISTTPKTAFLIRLAPSVSNAIIGDLGERELLNRAQMLLKSIEVTSDTGSGALIVEGILNPNNYPTNPNDVAWSALSSQALGGQPSFAQVAPAGGIDWGNTTPVTVTISTLASDIDTGFIYNGLYRGNYQPLYLDSAQVQADPIAVGSVIYSQNPDRFTDPSEIFTVTSVNVNGIFGAEIYYQSSLGNNLAQGNQNGGTTYRFVYRNYTGFTNRVLFTKVDFDNANITIGTKVSATDTNWPAGTAISNVKLLTLGSVEFYEITFNQTSVGNLTDSQNVIFELGASSFAEPGETVFSFITNPGNSSSLDLGELKELTNTPLGGRGTYPNGPDILAINVTKVSGAAINSSIILRWGEAQA